MIRFSHNAPRYPSPITVYRVLDGILVRSKPQRFGSISLLKNIDNDAKHDIVAKADSGARPTKYALCTTLNSCAKSLNCHLGLQIHAQIVRNGYEDNLILSSALVDFYAKCNRIDDARRIFSGMKQHDQVSWTSIISGYTEVGNGAEAFVLFKDMLKSNTKPNCFTYVSIITACSRSEVQLQLGSTIHAHIVKLGFVTNIFVASSLIDVYSKGGEILEASSVFHAVGTRDVILYNSMIVGYCHNLFYEDALKLFVQMKEDGVGASNFTMSSILNACGSLSVLCLGRQVHCLVIKLDSVANVFVLTSLIDMYSKSGSIDEARSIFNQTAQRNSVLWTSMISGYAHSGRATGGLQLFDQMVEDNCFPDHVCFTSVFNACNHAGLLDRAVEYFDKMRKDYGLVPKLDHYACLIDLHARKGHLGTAIKLMDTMPFDPNAVVLSSLLSCCKKYGAVELGKKVASKLFLLQPHGVASYVTMAHIYAKAGLWDEVTNIKRVMKQQRIKKSAAWSWVEVDGRVDVFLVGDMSHPKSTNISMLLDLLNLKIKDVQTIRNECLPDDALLSN